MHMIWKLKWLVGLQCPCRSRFCLGSRLSLTENSCLLESFPKPGTFPKRLHFLPANSYDHAPKISCSIPEFSWFITFCKPTPHPTMWRSERSVLKQLQSNSNLAHPLPLAEFGNPYDHKTLLIPFPYRLSNNSAYKSKQLPLTAITLLAGFIIAESAAVAILIGLVESFMSMMTAWVVFSTFSLTQINLSDSIVTVLNPMFSAFTPTSVSYAVKLLLSILYRPCKTCIVGLSQWCL